MKNIVMLGGRWCIFKHELVDGDSEWENGSYYWQKRECKECGFSQFSLQKLLI